jgi:hypothetical protein
MIGTPGRYPYFLDPRPGINWAPWHGIAIPTCRVTRQIVYDDGLTELYYPSVDDLRPVPGEPMRAQVVFRCWVHGVAVAEGTIVELPGQPQYQVMIEQFDEEDQLGGARDGDFHGAVVGLHMVALG